jgi:effector-binding domain-containing protein
MEIVGAPNIVHRPETPYLGIRLVTPFRGMLSVRDRLLTELHNLVVERHVDVAGAYFLRLHVIDMKGPMNIEVGVMTTDRPEGDDRVRAGVLPAGDYATLTYREHDIRANRALLEWARANGVQLDRSDDPSGDRFACRYEAYLTDPWTERRRKKWTIQLNMRVRDAG